MSKKFVHYSSFRYSFFFSFDRMDSYTGPVLDSVQNVNLLNAEITSDGNVTIEFNRFLNTNDGRDRVLVPNTLQRFNWAFNPAPNAVQTVNGSVLLKHPTPNRGSFVGHFLREIFGWVCSHLTFLFESCSHFICLNAILIGSIVIDLSQRCTKISNLQISTLKSQINKVSK